MRLSLKGEKRKKKKARLCPFFSIKKKKVLGELDSSGQFRFSHVTETGHLAAASNSTGRLGEQALHGQADFSFTQHMLTVHGAENTSTSDAPHTANQVNSKQVMEHQVHSLSVACTAPL